MSTEPDSIPSVRGEDVRVEDRGEAPAPAASTGASTLIPHDRIDPDAQKVVLRLARAAYQAYFVGGCVRDLLLGRRPKDFDWSMLCVFSAPN